MRNMDSKSLLLLDNISSPAWFLPGAWTHISNPRAVYSTIYNKTYFGAVNTDGTIWIAAFNHSNNTLSSYNLHTALEYDSHTAPSILIRNDGRLIVFYSTHTGNNIYYRISINPGDINSFGAEQTLNMGGMVTYSRPVQLSGEDNKIYLFFRGLGTNSWSYITSTDGGVNWGGLQQLFTIADQANQYLVIATNGIDKIYFGHGGHPSLETCNIYSFYYHGGHFYKTDGTLIETPVPFGRADMTLVYDATAGGHYSGWIGDIAIVNTIPYIVFYPTVTVNDHRYIYAKWTGSEWVHYEIATAGGEIPAGGTPGGITLDHNNPAIVYISKEIDDRWEIQKGITLDGGVNWILTPITSGSVKDNIIPVIPISSHNDLPVLWMVGDFPSYLTYLTYIISSLDIYPEGYDKITVVTPNGGETIYREQNYDITWTYELCLGVTNVKIELLKAGAVVNIIVAFTPIATKTYTWSVPVDITLGTDYKVKITTL